MSTNDIYIGMDLGGTTFKALAVSPDGAISDAYRATPGRTPARSGGTQYGRGPAAVADGGGTAHRRLVAIGFGIPGILDLPQGIIRRSPNLPSWQNFDLRRALQRVLDVPFTIENDANAAALGEAWLGAGRGLQHFLMLTLGTGVGGGVIIAGKILHGAHGYAGELGHTVVDPHGPLCGCGSYGCLEQFASGAAVARMAEPYYGKTTAKAVALAARRGEPQALEVYHRVGRYLGIACASFANLFNPQAVVIGGAMARAFDLFSETMHTTMRERTFLEVYNGLRLVPAECGNDAGGLGAAYQAMQLVHPEIAGRDNPKPQWMR